MAYRNGQLPASALSPITNAASGDRVSLRKDAAAAFMAMNSEARMKYGVPLRVLGGMSANRTLAQQQWLWDHVAHRHDPNWVARPGTSNHGWGIAIDLSSYKERRIVDAIGARYGWAKRWSDAPLEWWHIRWREGVWTPPADEYPVLRKGVVNREATTRLQRLLRSLHLMGVPLNGRYDLATRLSVKRFQRKHGLVADGVVGTKTWAALEAATNK